jgi:hypothetical protein
VGYEPRWRLYQVGGLQAGALLQERDVCSEGGGEVSKELDICDDRRRRELADSILSILYRRFRWMDRDPTACAAANNHVSKAIDTCNEAALTVEATIGAMLDALHARNEETMERWQKYMDAAPSRIIVGR